MRSSLEPDHTTRKVLSPYIVLLAKNLGKPEEADRKHKKIGALLKSQKSLVDAVPLLVLLSLVSAEMFLEGAPNMTVKEKEGNRRINKLLSLFDSPGIPTPVASTSLS